MDGFRARTLTVRFCQLLQAHSRCNPVAVCVSPAWASEPLATWHVGLWKKSVLFPFCQEAGNPYVVYHHRLLDGGGGVKTRATWPKVTWKVSVGVTRVCLLSFSWAVARLREKHDVDGCSQISAQRAHTFPRHSFAVSLFTRIVLRAVLLCASSRQMCGACSEQVSMNKFSDLRKFILRNAVAAI